MALGLLADVAEGHGAAQHHHCISGDCACQKDEEWQVALGLLAEMAESAGQRHVVTASPAMVIAERMKTGR